jgi:hypothetical protein
MCFSSSPESLGLYVGDTVDVLFNVDINEWGGRKSVQLIVRDIKETSSQRSLAATLQERFFEVWSGARFSADENILPTREDFAQVYRLVVNCYRAEIDTLSVKDIVHKLSHSGEKSDIGYIKLKVIIKVMQ